MAKKKDEITIRSSAAEYLTYVASVGDQQDSIEICWSWKKAQRNKDQISGRDGEIRQLNSLRVYGKSVV